MKPLVKLKNEYFVTSQIARFKREYSYITLTSALNGAISYVQFPTIEEAKEAEKELVNTFTPTEHWRKEEDPVTYSRFYP